MKNGKSPFATEEVFVPTSTIPTRDDVIGDFEYAGNQVQSRFVVSFMFKGSPSELMQMISSQGALHVASEDIKGVVVKEKGTTNFRNRRYRSK